MVYEIQTLYQEMIIHVSTSPKAIRHSGVLVWDDWLRSYAVDTGESLGLLMFRFSVPALSEGITGPLM